MSLLEKKELFVVKDTFVSDQKNKEDVFKEVFSKLSAEGLVKPEFLENLLLREKNFPTGIDLSVVDPDLPNVAIPHTEGKFVNVCQVIPIKCKNPITFYNMIEPQKKIEVSFLFMILNNDPEGQSNILAEIMDFLTTTSKNSLKAFFKADEDIVIFNFLNNNFS